MLTQTTPAYGDLRWPLFLSYVLLHSGLPSKLFCIPLDIIQFCVPAPFPLGGVPLILPTAGPGSVYGRYIRHKIPCNGNMAIKIVYLKLDCLALT